MTASTPADGSSDRDAVRGAIKQRAFEHEHAGQFEEALRAWDLLRRAGGNDGLSAIARSRSAKLKRRLEDRSRASDLVSRGDEVTRAAVAQAERDGRYGLVIEVRRLQVDAHRDAHSLAALGSALRRGGELDEAATVLQWAIGLDPSDETNRAAYVAKGALLREAGDLREARALLERLHRRNPGDAYAASALAAVYLDYVEGHGMLALLEPAERLIKVAYAQLDRAEIRNLYRRFDAVKRRVERP
jgi:tetratricopeptide (TPR) repeat protein